MLKKVEELPEELKIKIYYYQHPRIPERMKKEIEGNIYLRYKGDKRRYYRYNAMKRYEMSDWNMRYFGYSLLYS